MIIEAQIYGENLPKLHEGVARFNRHVARLRARGYDAEDLKVKVLKSFCKPNPDGGLDLVFVNIEITGSNPHISGWEVVAVLSHDEAGTVIRQIPSAHLEEGALLKYRDTGACCEHCNQNRKRLSTYVIRAKATGQLQQIGRACVEDFTGIRSTMQGVIQYAEILTEIQELAQALACVISKTNIVSISQYLGFVVAAIEKYGWMSRAMAKDKQALATADIAWNYGAFWYDNGYESMDSKLVPTEDHQALADQALEWCQVHFDGLMDSGILSDYEYNLHVVVRGMSVNQSKAGIAASLIQYWKKATNQVPAKPSKPVSEYVGEVGEKKDFGQLKLAMARGYDTNYGWCNLYSFEDKDGNIIIWKTSSRMNLEEGKLYKVTGKIKAHSMYKGTKQTILLRPKVAG